jgi:predicted TIM-barrel fold metal-dependent hydrolase
MLYGRSYYWPIFAAAEKHDLPVGLHAGSMFRYAPTSNGWPSHYLHDYVAQSQTFEDQLLSMVSEGLFSRFPSLRVVLLESGVSWLPSFLWRAVKTWRGVRAEVPWVKQPPATIVSNHVRLTMQPFDAPRDAAIVAAIIEQIGCDDMLLFATDYPHWQFDGNDAVPGGIPSDMLHKIMIDNPLATYPRLREAAS